MNEEHSYTGTWAQGDCVWIEGDARGSYPCDEYRRKMSRADIAVSTHKPDAIRVREIAAEKSRIQHQLSAQAAELRDAIALAYDELHHGAPQNNVAVSNAMQHLLDAYHKPTGGKALLEKLERMEVMLGEIASYGSTYPTSAPEHEICHALVVAVPDMAHQGLRGKPN